MNPPDSSPVPRLAVLGCGYWGRNLVRNFHDLGALAAVIDPAPAGRATAASLAPGVPVFSSLAEAQGGTTLAAVAIATPAATHFANATAAMSAGLDVFVEKPLALTLTDGSALVAQADAGGRILQVGHLLEYHPALPVLTEWVRSGKLGRLRRLQAHRLNWGKVRTEEDALWSLAPHDLAVILRLTGTLPTTVTCRGSYILGTPRADTTVTTLGFPHGVEAHVLSSWYHPFKEQRIIVTGDHGIAVFDDVARENKLCLHGQSVQWRNTATPELHQSPPQPAVLADEEPLRRQCAAFLEAIRTRQPPLADGASGLRVLCVLDACRRSMLQDGAPMTCQLPCP
jgi:predicted dehydrogenase